MPHLEQRPQGMALRIVQAASMLPLARANTPVTKDTSTEDVAEA